MLKLIQKPYLKKGGNPMPHLFFVFVYFLKSASCVGDYYLHSFFCIKFYYYFMYCPLCMRCFIPYPSSLKGLKGLFKKRLKFVQQMPVNPNNLAGLNFLKISPCLVWTHNYTS